MERDRKIRAVRGVKDILPREVGRWQRAEEIFHGLFAAYGYGEIRMPIFEETALFRRSIGEETDIVEKEMYTFADKGGTSITLRPEGTASAVRAFIEHDMRHLPAPVKLYYIGPMFRHERPQKGRLRQFHQVGAEIFGLEGPEAEAELLEMLMFCLEDRFELPGLALQVNTLGDEDCRPAYREALKTYLDRRRDELCEDCRRRMVTNPFRVLDCKAEGCGRVAVEAPAILSFLCAACREHFETFQLLLDDYGVSYRVNPQMVRGLDYYTRTTFEVVSTGLGAQNAVVGGGRYDGLVAQFGGPPTPGLGFALGLERLVSLVGQEDAEAEADVYLAALDDAGRREARLLAGRLRHMGVKAGLDYLGRSLKGQMRQADRQKAALVAVLGGDELAAGKGVLKEMATGEQREVELEGLPAMIYNLLGESAEREPSGR